MARQVVTIGLLAVAVLAAPFARAQLAGQVQVVVGEAKLLDATGATKPLERGAQVQQGDRIVTGDGGLVQLKLADGSFVSVRTNTDATIEKFRFNEQVAQESSMLIRLTRGALRSITGLIGSRSPDAYRIVTPTATIGIRGTDHEPVYIPEPRPGEMPIGVPGTYDKVNSGATFIQTKLGMIDVRPGQVGFAPVVTPVPPKLLPTVPDFFKRLDGKGDLAQARGTRSAVDGKTLARPTIGPTVKTEGVQTLNTTVISPTLTTISPTLTTTISPTLTTTISPTLTTTISPTLTTTISPTLTTTISPTLTTTISPTLTTTISPTLTTTISPTLTTTISPTLNTTTTISPLLVR